MAGWRKAWLSVLDRAVAAGAGGGSTGSLQGLLHFPSFLANYKRGGKYGTGHVSGKAVAACFAVALALAFFYASVTSGPAAPDGSFPSPAAASFSSSVRFLPWLSSNSSKPTSPKKSLPTHPPAAIAVGATNGRNRNATVVSPLPDVGNATVGSDAEPTSSNGNRTREDEPQVETATPMLKWGRTDGDDRPSHDAAGVVGAAAGQQATTSTDDVATGNSGDTGTSSIREEPAKNAAAGYVQSLARRSALPSRPERKAERHRRRRAARHRHPRRRKETMLSAQDLAAAAERSHEEMAGVKTSFAVGAGNDDVVAGVNTSMAVEAAGNDDLSAAGRNASTGAGNNRVVWTSGVQDLVAFAKCDVFSGRWVRDESYGFYPPKSCALIDDDFNCHKNGRPDSDFLRWRWQPHGCDIPRYSLTPVTFLKLNFMRYPHNVTTRLTSIAPG